MSKSAADFFRQVRDPNCPKCQGVLPDEDEFCKTCGARNPRWNTLHKDKCPNCLFYLADPTDKYCRLCGTFVGEGTYNPIVVDWEYGPLEYPPVDRKHICYQCGYTWYSYLHDQYRFCPKCGGRAPAL